MPIYIVKSWYKKGWTEKVWVPKTWYGVTSFSGSSIWQTDNNIYYTTSNYQSYKLNKESNTWTSYTFSSKPRIFQASNIWRNSIDGKWYHTYDSSTSTMILNTAETGWSSTSFSGVQYPSGSMIWRDNNNVTYYSYDFISSGTYYLSAVRTWTLVDYFTYPRSARLYGQAVWKGKTGIIYHSRNSYQYSLSENVWSAKTWNISNLDAYYMWDDKDGHVYYSINNNHSELVDESDGIWENKVFSGLESITTSFGGYSVWHDGNKTYYSSGTDQYELV